MKKEIILTVGIPGSGKTTFCEQFMKITPYEHTYFSSDFLRAHFSQRNDESDQSVTKEVFNYIHNGVEYFNTLPDFPYPNHITIVDATNLNPIHRQAILVRAKHAIKVAWVFMTPLEECLKRNAQRNRVVPEAVIRRMHSQYIAPTYEEGFFDIVYINNL